MEYLDRLLAEMDPALKSRILDGEYMRLLEPSLPPTGHPLRQYHLRQALTGIPRGEAIAGIVGAIVPLPGSRTLDIGCGDGGISIAFARAGARVMGIDASPDRISHARALTRDVGAESAFELNADFGESLPAGSFDIIVTNDVIEHVDDFERLARSQARLLAPGGILFTNPPNRFSLRLVLSDPHYHLAFVSLMGQRMGRIYCERIRRRTPHYSVNHLLGYYEVLRLYRRAGLDLTCCSTERIRERLTRHDLPAAWQRMVAGLIPLGWIEPLIRLLLLDQWIFIGRHRR